MAMAWTWPIVDLWSSFSRAAPSMVLLLLRLITGASLDARWIDVRGVFKGVVAVEVVLFLEEEEDEVPEILKKDMAVYV
ncbi:MAG: hypothetical protein BYD32DRAFT_404870 [Podila humilis]|nr:MAG: hypothetical protein BYD32DRAFT_404870 [Podila humilis]